jgi:hypothetical protein
MFLSAGTNGTKPSASSERLSLIEYPISWLFERIILPSALPHRSPGCRIINQSHVNRTEPLVR